MQQRLGWLFLLLCSLWLQSAFAQSWERDSILSQLRAQTITPDNRGFLWVGSETGVYRYDGHELIPLNSFLAAGKGKLPSCEAYHLLFTPDGTLWCGTQQGLFRYWPTRHLLERIPLYLRGSIPSVQGLKWIPEKGSVWVFFGDLMEVLIPLSKAPAANPDRAFLTNAEVKRSNRVMAHSIVDAQLTRFILAPDAALLPLPGSNGRWQVNRQGLYEVLPGRAPRLVSVLDSGHRANPSQVYPPPLPFVPVVAQKDWYWFTEDCRLVTLRLQPNDQPPRIEWLALPPKLGARARLDCVANGYLWACTGGATYRRAVLRPLAKAIPAAVPSPSIRGIERHPDGRLLVGYYNGLLTQSADSPDAPLRPFAVHDLPSYGIVPYDMVRLPDGRLVLASEIGPPAGELDLSHRRYQPFCWATRPTVVANAYCLLQDQPQRLWCGTVKGLFQIDIQRGTYGRYLDADTAFGLHNCQIEQLAEAPAGILWAATNQGLYRLNLKTNALTRYSTQAVTRRQRLPTNLVLCLYASHPDSIWLGTRDQGVLLIHPDRGVVRQIAVAQGLPNPSVASILPEKRQGVLWLGTFAGLARYTCGSGEILTLRKEDGLATMEFNRQAAWRDPANGFLYFGGVGGLTRIDPAAFGENVRPRPQLLVTQLQQHQAVTDRVMHLPLNGAPPPEGFRLAPGDAFLELGLTLAGSQYFGSPQDRYFYRLVGSYDRHFRPVNAGNRLRLQQLAAGKYLLEIKARTYHGIVARNVLRIPLVVEAYWWQGPGIWAVGVLLVSGLVAAGVFAWQQQRTRRLLHEQQLRANIAADLHDETGALLTRMALRAEMLRLTPGDDQNLDVLVQESRSAAATIRDIIWSVDTNSDKLGALLDRIRDHLAPLQQVSGWEIIFDDGTTSAQMPNLEVLLRQAIRQHTYLIFKEAVTNAIKHGRGSSLLHVSLRCTPQTLELRVVNNGEAAQPTQRSGQGIRNMEQRAARVGGTLAQGPLPNGGWQVWLHIPNPMQSR